MQHLNPLYTGLSTLGFQEVVSTNIYTFMKPKITL